MSDKKDKNTATDIELAQIEKFYKDIPGSDKKDTTTAPSQTKSKKSPVISVADDEEIHDSSYGMNRTNKSILMYLLTFLLCGAIVGGAYLFTVFAPGDEAKINSAVMLKRLESSYVDINSRHKALLYDLGKLRTEAEEKKKNVESVQDYENSKAMLRNSIEEKKTILDALNNELTQKQGQITALDSAIAQKNINSVTLSPGKYTVGKNLLAGKYSVSGSGKFMVASSDNVSKINVVLGAEPYEAVLEKNDIIKLETTAKFTPIY